ncbi:winged helix-turn-helix transcriptional regulator [Micromonospora sp. C51]|uniref:winged helix-turn-helix domain-containing protein n=1 Tax=Micromonospora sp. C51 TaxID=2824879 RepID=UPI001B386780|nr:winged helix-turn-helix domain-containing protein [Micromonospora sp. C51]MBQ1047754.1 winged helix-turn-helix transcriptional regulator [Micromonospora sp. C51]
MPDVLRLPSQRANLPERELHLTITVHLRLDAAAPHEKDLLRQLVERLSAVSATGRPGWFGHVRPDVPDGPDVVRIDPDARTVTRGGVPVELCRREYDLLLFFAEHPGRVFTRTQILDVVWNQPFTGPRTVDVHIRRLRHKLGVQPPLITTVHGVGYRLAADAPVVLVRALYHGFDGAKVSVAPTGPLSGHLRRRAA